MIYGTDFIRVISKPHVILANTPIFVLETSLDSFLLSWEKSSIIRKTFLDAGEAFHQVPSHFKQIALLIDYIF